MEAHVQAALDRIKQYANVCETYVGTSGGKDSVVVQHLAARCGITTLVHNVKAETHPATIALLYKQPGLHYVQPKQHAAFCKSNRLTIQIDGTRIAEAGRTDGRSTDLVINGQNVSRENMPVFVANGLQGLSFLYPILDWSDKQVWDYIRENKIEFSAEYYETMRTLIVAPHPDDEMIGCWTVLKTRKNVDVVYGPASYERVNELMNSAGELGYEFIRASYAMECLDRGEYIEVYVPSRNDAHAEHKAMNRKFYEYATHFYSVDMVDAIPLPEEEAQEKLAALNKFYPSQRALWDRDHKYFLFESIHTKDYKEYVELKFGDTLLRLPAEYSGLLLPTEDLETFLVKNVRGAFSITKNGRTKEFK